MRVIQQIVREFLLPLLIGVGWAWYGASSSPGHNLQSLITNFAAAFFLASWAIGQVVRIKRQQTTEDSFESLKSSLNRLQEMMARSEIALGKLLERVAGDPSLEPVVRDLVTVTQAANTQVDAANTVLSAIRNQQSDMGWYQPWSTSPPRKLDPRLFGGTVEAPAPPDIIADTTTVKSKGKSLFDDAQDVKAERRDRDGK